MKRLAVFAAACALGACSCEKAAAVDAGVPDAGPLMLTEKEPNDGPAQALPIGQRAVVQANLGADPARPDEDWYVLTGALPRTASISVSCPPGADVAIEVMDEARNTLMQVNAQGPDKEEVLPNLDVSGKAFFRVVGMKKGAGGSYTVTVGLGDRQPGFELEPNNRAVDATQVALGQAVSGYLSHPADEDWYRFELPGDGTEVDAGQGTAPDAGDVDAGAAPTEDAGAADAGATDAGPAKAEPAPVPLRVDLSGVSGVRPEVTVLTVAEAVLFDARAAQDGAGLSLRNVGIRAQDRVIYVVVKGSASGAGKDARKGYNPSQYYTLTVAQEEAGSAAELEPNDEAAKATALPVDSWKEGFLVPRGDVDCYRLTVPGPSIVDVTVTGVDKIDLQLSLVQPADPATGKAEEVLAKANEGAVKEPESLHSVACVGACVFRVEPTPRKVDGKWVKDQENGETGYRISATVTPDDGSREKEPNNTPDRASPLALGASVRGTVFPKKDLDLFRLDLSAKQVKTPLKATLTGVLKVDVGLYLHRLGEDGKLELVQTSDRAKRDAPEVVRFSAEPGIYVFEVRDSKNREANFQDQYQLTVEETDD